MAEFVVGVAGNPNCGKTTLFNQLTGARQRVGNWPGVTVERKTGHYTYADRHIELVDLPGIYSLDAQDGHASLDEKVAQDYLLSGEAGVVINIVDATNLERNLYLTSQLLDMDVPLVVALNMMDMTRQAGMEVNPEALAEKLGVPVIPIVASRGEGLEQLQLTVLQMANQSLPREAAQVTYPRQVEAALAELRGLLRRELPAASQPHARWLGLTLLESGEHSDRFSPETSRVAGSWRGRIEQETEEDLDILIADARYRFIGEAAQATVRKTDRLSRSLSDKIDRIVLNRWLGIPIFLLVMYSLFLVTINLGGAFIDFFDILAGAFLVDGMAHLLAGWGAPEWLSVLLSNGLGGGIQVVATFIPIIAFLYLFLSLLEDSGYMARAAFVMDRFMRFIGLPGKSFVPLLVGFGCNVPSVMASRTLENRRDRYLTTLMAPFMSCGARLPVYALFAAVFFPSGGHNLVFGLYLLGIAAAVLTGLIMKNTLLKGEAGYFVMELPPYHVPGLRGVAWRTWERLREFIWRAGKIIVPMVVVISFLNAWGTDGSFGHEDSDQSVLSEVGRELTPMFAPMGISEDNWPAVVGIFTGILAKEVVVGTLDALYAQQEGAGTSENAGPLDLGGSISEAFASVSGNLSALGAALLDPLGLGDARADAGAMNQATHAAMVASFDGQIGAFAYLLFILMYFPCAAVVAALYQETGARWAIFVTLWSTGLAYFSATLFYQAATFARHPDQSLAWILGLLLVFGLTVLALSLAGRRRDKATARATQTMVANC